VLLFADYNAGTAPWYSLLCFTVMVLGISFLFAWMRLKSGSLWTGVLLHASHNLFIQSFFDRITADTGHTRYIIGEFGAGLAIAAVCLALYFWWRRDEVNPRAAAA
jgi:membrane protease YdiL (CAAX protease family)